MRRLTRVRKLLRSVTVQVNIGDKQVNVAGDNAVVDGGQGQPAVSRRVLIGSWQRTVNYFTVGRESSGGALAGHRIHDEVRRSQVYRITDRRPGARVARFSGHCASGGRLIVLNEEHLRRVLADYFSNYQEGRTHLSLERNAPILRSARPPETGKVVAKAYLGGVARRRAHADADRRCPLATGCQGPIGCGWDFSGDR